MSTFEFQGKTYSYGRGSHERVVEVPICYEIVRQYPPERVLEVGNVLRHYAPVTHDVVDKYEPGTGIINEDTVDYSPNKTYDLIMCISTLEHIGFGESPYLPPLNEPNKALRAVENLTGLLAEGGRAVFTWPVGVNKHLDGHLKEGRIKFTKVLCLKRISEDNQWKQVEWEEIKDSEYGHPFPAGNGVVIVIIEKRGKT